MLLVLLFLSKMILCSFGYVILGLEPAYLGFFTYSFSRVIHVKDYLKEPCAFREQLDLNLNMTKKNRNCELKKSHDTNYNIMDNGKRLLAGYR